MHQSLSPLKRDSLKGKLILSAIKGIVPEYNKIVAEYFNTKFDISFENIGIISGPSHAEEVALEKLPHRDVFIYLGQETLEQIHAIVERFERVIEVVSLEENDLHAGRERYKHYRSLGFELQNYDQKGA